MTVSSAARSSASASNRLVSSNRRAFASAAPIEVASVPSRRSSPSSKASTSRLSSASTPMTREPDRIGTPSQDSDVRAAAIAPSAIALGRWSRSGAASGIAMTRDVRPSPNGIGPLWIRSPSSISYGNVITPHGSSYRAMNIDLRVNMRPHPLADEVDDRLEVELAGERVADLVDDGQLGVALFGLAEQALRLVEQAGVLERTGHARRDRSEESLRCLVVGVLLKRLHPDGADHPLADQDRDAQP